MPAIGTIFSGDEFRYYDWDAGAFDGGPHKIKELGLPAGFDPISAACVNPLDKDVVWLFSKDKVLDYGASALVDATVEQRPLRRGRVVGGTIEIDVAVAIKDHPVFGVLGADFQQGIASAHVSPPKTPGRGTIPWVILATKAKRTALVMTSLYRALEFGGPVQSPAGRVINGAGKYDRWTFSLDDGSNCTLTHLDGAAPSRSEAWTTWFPGFKPDAGVPVRLLPPRPRNVAGAPGPRANGPTGPNAAAPTSTFDDRSFSPPDSLVVIPGRGTPAAPGPTLTYLRGLRSGAVSDPQRVQGLQLRNDALVTRLTTGKDIPDFLRTFVPIRFPSPVPWSKSADRAKAAANKAAEEAVGMELIVFVAPDFLSVGNDYDWCRVPLSAPAGQKVLDHHGCMYPTRRICLEVYDETPASQRIFYIGRTVKGHELDDGGATSTEWIIRFQQDVESEERFYPYSATPGQPKGMRAPRGRSPDHALGRLLSGAMKDVIISSVLDGVGGDAQYASWVMFWGGVDPSRVVHGAGGDYGITRPDHPYKDHNEYAMGLRMVYETAYIRMTGGRWTTVPIPTILSGKPLPANLTEANKVLDADKFKNAYKLLHERAIKTPRYV